MKSNHFQGLDNILCILATHTHIHVYALDIVAVQGIAEAVKCFTAVSFYLRNLPDSPKSSYSTFNIHFRKSVNKQSRCLTKYAKFLA